MKFGRWLVVATALVAVAGCSKEIPVVDKDTLERQMFERIATEWGHNPQAVKCPSGLRGTVGAEQTCVLTDDGVDYQVTATVNEVKDNEVSFTIKTGEPLTVKAPPLDVYIDREDLERNVSDQLNQQLGRPPELLNCPNDLPAVLDAKVLCYLHDGPNVYDVVVTVTQVDGDNVLFDAVVAPGPR